MHCIVFLLELQKMNGSNEKVYNFTLFKKILWHSKIQIYSKSQSCGDPLINHIFFISKLRWFTVNSIK